MLKAALFDLDGTLIDTEHQYSIFWHEMGVKYRPDIEHFEEIIKGSTLTRILTNYIPEEHHEAVKKGVDDYEARMNYDFFHGALEFILDLKRHGVKTAVVTSSDQKKMSHFKRYCAEHLPQGIALSDVFDKIMTAEDFAASKPDPDCYLRAAAYFGASLEECIVFEDAFNGLEAGMRSGILTIGLATYNPADVIKDKCHHVMLNYEGATYESVAKLLNF